MKKRLGRAGLALLLMTAGVLAQAGPSGVVGKPRKAGPPAPPLVSVVPVMVDASVVHGSLAPLWRDHYDLSTHHLDYLSEPAFLPLAQSVQPRSWRCSVGRWEIGMTPPPGGTSVVPGELALVEREYYRGPNTLAGADNPANYNFIYLDAQLADICAMGAEPFLCFDYMPFMLSSQQSALNPDNLSLTDPTLSFSNGIRTAPPSDPAVYARVVRNTARHVRGLFAGDFDFEIGSIEVGNEPDLVNAAGTPMPYFWTGTRAQWMDMYAHIAAEIDADPLLTGLVEIGAGSFAFQPHVPEVTFLEDFLTDVSANGRRLDFVSYHSYADDLVGHLYSLIRLTLIRDALGLAPELVNAEWGRSLDGFDPVYDSIEHGLFRTKVMMLMLAFGVTRSHEALFRDVMPGSDQPGLVFTGPATGKPVTDVYEALNLMNVAPLGLATATPDGTFAMAGKSANDTRVVVVWVGDNPGVNAKTRLDLSVTSLPWGSDAFSSTRYEVSDASWAAGLGVTPVATQSGLRGPVYVGHATLGPGPGAGALVVWELVRD